MIDLRRFDLKTFIRDGLDRRGVQVRRNPFADPVRLKRTLIERDDPVIFDVGAYIGRTCRRYRQAFPAAHIYAFEPYPDSYAKLVEATAGSDRTRAFPYALGMQEETLTFRVNQAKATNSLLAPEAEANEIWGGERYLPSEEIGVPVVTLDDFCHEQGIDTVDLLKIDVQGHEYAVLEGARGLLEAQRIHLVYMEFIFARTYRGQRALHEYLALMDGHGYELLDLFEPNRKAGRLLQCDLLFARPSA